MEKAENKAEKVGNEISEGA
jgi:hypothetical protein